MAEIYQPNAMGLLFKDKISYNPNYRDLRDLQDTKTVLKNPHKGWYWHYIDNGYGSGLYRDDHDPEDFLMDFPGLNHLYLRFDWGDIEKEEGVLDWSYIDEIFETWGAKGYSFSLRVCTFEACSKGSLAFATPEWVFKAGAKYQNIDGAYEPDYGDPIFLKKISVFMKKFGEKFNGHPLVEFVDIGTFGTWGEGHSGYGSDTFWPFDVMKTHIDLHVKNFPDTFVLLNDDYICHRNQCKEEENIQLMNYAVQLGTGLRDDSVCVDYYHDNCGYDTLRAPFMYDHFWKQAPVDLEYEHYSGTKEERFKNGLPFLSAMMRARATYAGFHGYPRVWLEKNRYFTEYCANRLGYWFFVEAVLVTELVIDAQNFISFYFTNRGFAPAYRKYDVRIKLVNKETSQSFEQSVDMDTTGWAPGEMTCERVKITPFGIEKGEYILSLGMFFKENPILIGIKSEHYFDGFYRLTEVNLI